MFRPEPDHLSLMKILMGNWSWLRRQFALMQIRKFTVIAGRADALRILITNYTTLCYRGQFETRFREAPLVETRLTRVTLLVVNTRHSRWFLVT